jgi:hypothetical protein
MYPPVPQVEYHWRKQSIMQWLAIGIIWNNGYVQGDTV